MSEWTRQIKDNVRELWKRNFSASKIALEINTIYGTKFSRNAVIGITHREGLRGTTRRKHDRRSYDHFKDMNLRKKIIKKQAEKKVPISPDNPINNPAFRTLHGEEKKICQLDPNDCKFPLDTPDGMLFCAKPRGEHASYCPDHQRLCIIREEKK